ncbi:MAG: phenylalanine--tRNA ligase beta subunit-related protein [Acidobacteriota bacterium]|nr:phenylalanine--tRNA ligase beta subunit-related protein [Acidobacteriota bacterium]
MPTLPLVVEIKLDGWHLFSAQLDLCGGAEVELRDLRREVSAEVPKRLDSATLASHPPLAALRKLFRAAGCDPTRYRPSSEALLRRLTQGAEIPEIHPLVDMSNCLSAELAVPCCVMSDGTFTPPMCFRAGIAGEAYESLRGPFSAEGKPLLVDSDGPCDTPITGSERVKVTANTERAWLVAYLPKGVVSVDVAAEKLSELLRRAPVATVRSESVPDRL